MNSTGAETQRRGELEKGRTQVPGTTHFSNKFSGVTDRPGWRTTNTPTPINNASIVENAMTSLTVQAERTAQHQSSVTPRISIPTITAITAYFSCPKNVSMSCGGRYGVRTSSKSAHS